MHQLDNQEIPVAVDESMTFAEREARRRKRQLRLYLALLAIPVVVGVVILIAGRSDSQMVTDEVRKQASPVVQKEIREQIKPTIQDEVQTQVSSIKPNIKSEIQTEFAASLGQIGELKTQQNQLASDVKELKSSEVRLTPEDLTTIRQSREMFNKLERKDLEIQKLQTRIGVLEQRLQVTPDPRLRVTPEKLERPGKVTIETPIKRGPQ